MPALDLWIGLVDLQLFVEDRKLERGPWGADALRGVECKGVPVEGRKTPGRKDEEDQAWCCEGVTGRLTGNKAVWENHMGTKDLKIKKD